MLRDLGVSPGSVKVNDLVDIIKADPSSGRALIEFTKLTQQGLYSDEIFESTIKGMQSGELQTEDLQQLLKKANTPGGNITPAELTLIRKSVGIAPGFTERLIKEARTKGTDLDDKMFEQIESSFTPKPVTPPITTTVPPSVRRARQDPLPRNQEQTGIQSIIVKVGDTTFAKLVYDAVRGFFEPVVPPP